MAKEKSQLTTLCYIKKDNKYLMLHRVKKENDISKDKWLGIGGHFEKGESPEECLLREVKEETGLTLNSYVFRGIVTFTFTDPKNDEEMTEYMCLYTSDDFSGEMIECDEGDLEWMEVEKILKLPIWEGDKVFWKLINENAPFFSLKMEYYGDKMKNATLNGQHLQF